MKKQLLIPLSIWVFFMILAVSLGLTVHLFFLFNFFYIGTCVSVGMFLHMKKIKFARNVVLFAVGLYMSVILGIINGENMQIEGFWLFLFNGMFYAAVLHYAIAKIIGPLFFGRAWCGYACWTAMVLELLPFKLPRSPRAKYGFLRYLVFAAALILSLVLFFLKVPVAGNIMLYSFIGGNVLYYVIGIALAFVLKDNRAFCKYICPITVFLKASSYFAFLRVKNDKTKCIKCDKCKKACPMDVDMTDNSRKRTNGTECILCLNCIDECPVKALRV